MSTIPGLLVLVIFISVNMQEKTYLKKKLFEFTSAIIHIGTSVYELLGDF